MKSLFLATAAVAAFAAAPALAQSGPVGSVGVSYSNSEIDFGGLEADGDSYAVDGVVAVDALIVASAQTLGCGTLLTEDLQHGQDFDGRVVVSPFLVAPDEALGAR